MNTHSSLRKISDRKGSSRLETLGITEFVENVLRVHPRLGDMMCKPVYLKEMSAFEIDVGKIFC